MACSYPGVNPLTAIISNLTATAVLLHALLGCCWHHTHACAEGCPATVSAGSERVHGHEACGHPEHPEGDGHGGRHSGRCDGHRCELSTSLLAKTPTVVLPWLYPTALAGALPGDGPSDDGCLGTPVDDRVGPSVRPHLLHRVLLL